MEDQSLHLVADIPQKAIIKKNHEILLVKDAEDKLWELPGGRLHEGETSSEGLKRELQEELGILVGLIKIYDAFPFKSLSGKNHFVVVYICNLLSDPGLIIKNEEIKEVKWISANEFKDLPMRDYYKSLLNKFFESEN